MRGRQWMDLLAVGVVIGGIVAIAVVCRPSPLTANEVRTATAEFAADLRASGYVVDTQSGTRSRDDQIVFVTAVGGCSVEMVQNARLHARYQPFNAPLRGGRKIQPFTLRRVYNDGSGQMATSVVFTMISPTAAATTQYLIDRRTVFTCVTAA